jgi:uncharacterized membrane protein YdjX (TVP38/TMEM64 family)
MNPPEADTPRHTVGQRIVAAVTALLVLGVALLFAVGGRSLWHYFRHPAELRALVQNWGGWAPVGIVVFQMLQVVIAPLPGNVMSFVAGYALGLWPTIVWLMLGVLLGAAVDFLLARLLGRTLLRYLVPPQRMARLDSVILRRGTFYVFLLLLIPNPLGDWIYYLAGLTAIPLPLFLLLVLAARLPSNLLECALGSGATRFAWQHWVALAVLAALLTLVYFTNQRRIETWLDRLGTRGRSWFGRDSG